MPANDFRSELFEDPEEYEETLLRDRKTDLPVLDKKRAEPGKRAEFVRDVIAMANTARMTGRPAYLLFGIDNHGEVVGVNQYLEQHGGSWEAVRQQIKNLLLPHVEPPLLKWELKHGKHRQKLVAYLLIQPDTPERPFCIKNTKEPLRDEKKGITLDPGSCWIRIGESKQEIEVREIAPDRDSYRYAYSTVPYLLPSHWRQYFKRMLGQGEIVRDSHIAFLIELFVNPSQTLDERAKQFLNSPSERLLVIEGAATSGKSVFLNRLCARLAEEGLTAIEGIIAREEFLPPPGWIPVRIPLRISGLALQTGESLARGLLDTINELGAFWEERRPDSPEILLEKSDLKWLICFDGLDEMPECDQRKFLNNLRELMKRYPRIRVLLTKRPYSSRVDWKSWPDANTVTLQQLTDSQIAGFIGSQVTVNKDIEPLMTFLRSEPDLMALCAYPGYLVAIIRELVPESETQPIDAPSDSGRTQPEDNLSELTKNDDESTEIISVSPINAEELIYADPINTINEPNTNDQEDEQPAPRLGVVLERAYQYLWEREANRWLASPQHSSATWESAGRLAIESDGHRKEFDSDFLKRYMEPHRSQVRHWLFSLGILTETRDFSCAFHNELVKSFFAAWWIRTKLKGGHMEAARRKISSCETSFSLQLSKILPHIYDGDTKQMFPTLSSHHQID